MAGDHMIAMRAGTANLLSWTRGEFPQLKRLVGQVGFTVWQPDDSTTRPMVNNHSRANERFLL